MVPRLRPSDRGLLGLIKRASWSVSAGVAAALFVVTAAAFLRPPLLPDIGRDLGLSAIGLGALGSFFALGRLAADFPAGRSTERYRMGPMMALAAFLVGAGSLTFGSASSKYGAFVGVFVLGIGSAWTLTTAMAHFAASPKRRRGVAMSVFAGSLLAGQAVGPTMSGLIAEASDWRVALWAGAGLAGVVMLAFIIVTSRRMPDATIVRSPVQPVAAEESPSPKVLAVLYLLPAVQFSIGAALVQTLIPIVADGRLGLSVGVVGSALGLGGVARFLGAILAGPVSDRVGRKAALIPGLMIQMAGIMMLGLGAGRSWWWASIILLGLGSVGVSVGTTILADVSEGVRLGRRLGAFRFTGDLGFLVAPVVAGFLYERWGTLAAVLPVLALTLSVTIASIIVLPETLPRLQSVVRRRGGR